MATVLRPLIQKEIEGMEAGRFQDFCLRFLPCYQQRFKGLERHGHTASGKTRPGVPDLIKTFESGEQVGVECGTEQGYWGPLADVGKLKPYRDIAKCIDSLDRPVEIVAIASREIPRNAQNVKSQIAQAFQRQTRARVTLIQLTEISDFLDGSFEDPVVQKLIADYCPTVGNALGALKDQRKFQLAQDVARVHRAEGALLLSVVERAVESHSGDTAARDYALRELEAFSRCRVPKIPPFRGVHRESVDASPLVNPGGKVWVIVGLPKIGKSNMLLQLAPHWAALDVCSFEIPGDEAGQCVGEISAALLAPVLPANILGSVINSHLLRQEAFLRATAPPKPVLLVVDNTDRLPKEGIKQISEILSDLKNGGLIRAEVLSCIFFSSRSLPALAAADSILSAPLWTATELRLLLENDKDLGGVPGPAEQSDKYLEWLGTMSGGHPLFSLAVAKKCADLGELVTARTRGVPALGGEELSKDVQSFLYDDLLQDPDSQNFIQRLSILIGKQEEKELEVVRGVAPNIVTSLAVLLHRFGGSVIEGDAATGYEVPPVFREIARPRVGVEEMRAVYRDVADSLFQPDGKVLNAERATSSIVHGILGGEESKRKAMMRTAFLVMTVLRDRPPTEQLKAILARLDIVAFIIPAVDFAGQLAQTIAQIALAMGFQVLGDLERAAEILGRLRFDAAPIDGAPQLAKEKFVLRSVSIVFRAMCLAQKDPVGALKALGDLSPLDLAEVPDESRQGFLGLIPVLVGRCEYTSETATLVRLTIGWIKENDSKERDAALRIASAIAGRAKTDVLARDDISGVFSQSPLSALLRSFSQGTYLLESGREAESLIEIERSLQIAHDLGIEQGSDIARIQLAKGDAAFRLHNADLAQDAYARALKAAAEQSFELAWSSWRLGILRQDSELLLRSAVAFKVTEFVEMWGRAIGAGGALLIRSGRKLEGLRLLASVVDAYFVEGLEGTGAAATLALAHVTRLQAEAEGRELEKKEEFPPFDTSGYENVIADALPRSGPTLAFFNIGETYRALGEPNEARKWFRKAIDCDPVEKDYFSLSMAVERVLADLSAEEANDRRLFRRCAKLVMLQDRAGAFISRHFLGWCYFHACDAEFERTQKTQQMQTAIDALLDALDHVANEEPYWRGETSLRRAFVARARGEQGYAAKRFRQALENANKSEDASVLIAAGHALGFELTSEATSLREAAEFQFSAVRGIEIQKSEYERLLTVAHNLYSFWRNMRYSRLSEYDLKAKKLLKDSATDMEEGGVPRETAEAAMLLLLCKLYDHKGPCIEYVATHRPVTLETLPEDVKQKLAG